MKVLCSYLYSPSLGKRKKKKLTLLHGIYFLLESGVKMKNSIPRGVLYCLAGRKYVSKCKFQFLEFTFRHLEVGQGPKKNGSKQLSVCIISFSAHKSSSVTWFSLYSIFI